MQYPDEKLAATSRYSYEEICTTLDRWEDMEKRFDAAINAVDDYYALPQNILNEIDALETLVCPMDGIWHRAGNAERFPVKKWKTLIKQHERALSHLQASI